MRLPILRRTSIVCVPMALWLVVPLPATHAGTVTGTILSPTGQPVPGVTVGLDQFVLGGENGPWQATSGANGSYTVSDLLLFGNVRVTPVKAGLVAIPPFIDLFFDSQASAHFVMDLPGISGVVRDTASNPVAGATVTAQRVSAEGPLLLSAQTDASGRYRLRSDDGLTGTFSVRPTSASALFTPQTVTASAAEVVANFEAVPPLASLPVSGLSISVFEKGAWADYDNDGLADAMFFGGKSANVRSLRLFRQLPPVNGTRQFTTTLDAFTPIMNGDGLWRDFDNDGRLDFAAAGDTAASNLAELTFYRGTANGLSHAAGFQGLDFPTLAAADLNGDGLQDLLVAGNFLGAGRCHVWINKGAFQFDLVQPFPGAQSVSVADIDDDGDPDVALAGRNGVTMIAQIFRNDGGLSFTPLAAPFATGVQPLWAWADWNGDGRIDPALSHMQDNDNTFTTYHYRNDGDGVFTQQAALPGVPGIFSTEWGDLDGDGVPDLIENTQSLFRLTRPLNGGFILANGPGVGGASLPRHGAWVDLDGDLRLEIALTALATTSTGYLFRCPAQPPNAAPFAPSATQSTPASSSVRLSWLPATDDATPAPALTYNLRVGTTPGGVDVVSPMSDSVTGRRRVFERGSLESTHFTLTDLDPGRTYFWSVQAIDTSHAGGAWSEERAFVLGLPESLAITDGPAGSRLVTFSAPPSVAWKVQFSESLATWQTLGTAVDGGTGDYIFMHAGAAGLPRGFYRVAAP